MAPSMVIISLPVGARVSIRGPHAEHDQADATAIQVVHDPQQVGGASGQPIGLAGDQRIASADEAQGFLEPIALCHGGNLLGEDFLAAGSLQIADLGIQSGLLVAGRCPRITHQDARHRRSPPIVRSIGNLVERLSKRNRNLYGKECGAGIRRSHGTTPVVVDWWLAG